MMIEFPASKRYLKISEIEFARMIKVRKLNDREKCLTLYLRGKFVQFNKNPFYCKDADIISFLNWSKRKLQRVRELLRIKGIIDFESYMGRGHCTNYTMLDQFMASPRHGRAHLEEVKFDQFRGRKGVKSDAFLNNELSIKKEEIKRRGKQFHSLDSGIQDIVKMTSERLPQCPA